MSQPTKKRGRNNKPRSSSRKRVYQNRSAHSTAGKILPPLDVKRESDIPAFIERIVKGPISIIMVYADWCGHCHTMRPKFDTASNSPGRTCQVISINETQVENVNNALKSNVNKSVHLNPSGYPAGFFMQRNGESAPLELVPDALPEVMNNAGTLAKEAGLSNVNIAAMIADDTPYTAKNEEMFDKINDNIRTNLLSKSRMNPSTTVGTTSKINAGLTGITSQPSQLRLNSYVKEDKQQGSTAYTPLAIASPPTNDSDMSLRPLYKPVTNGIIGGSLYQAMSQAAYTLAPTAALIAAASIVTRQTRSKHSKHSKHLKGVKRFKRSSKKQQKQRKQRKQ